jgi:TPP-dependent pyruvate/acetoin dehydrogenase alpha subunit
VAAALGVPLVVVAEHNGYAYSTPTASQLKIKDLAQRASAYGIPARIVDGNDVLAVYEASHAMIEAARGGSGPQLLEVKTFRMKGHAEHDDASYVPKELFEQWKAKDPIDRFERHLLGEGLATQEDLDAIVARIQAELDAEVDFALASPMPPPERAHEGVYAE